MGSSCALTRRTPYLRSLCALPVPRTLKRFENEKTDFDLSTKVYQANLYSNGGEVHLAYEMENGKPVLTCHTDATGEADLFFEPADLPFARSGTI